MKKILSLLLVAVMVISVCACSKGGSTVSNDDMSEEYVINWMIPGTFGDDLELVNAEINKYVKEKINATVNLMPFDWGVYYTKIENMLNAGEKVDLAWTSGMSYVKFAKDKTATDITEMVDKYAPKTKEYLGKFIEGCYVDGGLYGIPANKDKGHYYGLVYRKDMAEKYGFDMKSVDSFEDLFPMFETIKQNEPGIWPFAIASNNAPHHLAYSDTYNVGVGTFAVISETEPTKVVDLLMTDEYKEAAKWARELNVNGYIYPDNGISDKSNEFKDNGMCFSWISQMHSAKLEELRKNYDYEIDAIPLTRTVTDGRDTMGSIMFIPYTSTNPERVMKFVELVNSDKYLNNLINFGIEGVHYEKVGENTIRSTDKKDRYNYIGNQWVIGNNFINYLFEEYDPERLKKLETFNQESFYPECFGLVLDTEPVEQQYTALKALYNRYIGDITNGTSDPEKLLSDYKKEAEAVGYNEFIAEMQRQTDEWFKNKK